MVTKSSPKDQIENDKEISGLPPVIVQASQPVFKSQITIQEVTNKKQLHQFIHLPAEIHKNHSNWVPPIYVDEKDFFNPKKNKSFQPCDTILLLAYKGKKLVVRIMGIIHRKYNEGHNEKHARFAFFETWNDVEVATELLHFQRNRPGGLSE